LNNKSRGNDVSSRNAIDLSPLHFLEEAAHKDIRTQRDNTLITNLTHQNAHSIRSLLVSL